MKFSLTSSIITLWQQIGNIKKGGVKKMKQNPSNRDEGYRIPILPGMRVCLNPEGRNYAKLKEQARDKKIYMLSLQSVEQGKYWTHQAINNLNDWYVTLITEDAEKIEAKYTDVLLVDAPSEDIIKITNYEKSVMTLLDKITEEEKEILIMYSQSSYEIFNDEWRTIVIQDATDYWKEREKKEKIKF